MGDNLILLVEDNPDDEELTLRALKRSNVANEIVVLHDGQEAIDYIFGTGSYDGRGECIQPRMILLDVRLPRVNGLEVLKRIRGDRRTSHLPVIMLTSSMEDRDRTDAYGSHANSYIRKPVDFEEFVDTVRQLGLYWLVLNRPPPDKSENSG